jgi:hypothetical protein
VRAVSRAHQRRTEAGVKFMKRNGLAALTFPTLAALETHLIEWMAVADRRCMGRP